MEYILALSFLGLPAWIVFTSIVTIAAHRRGLRRLPTFLISLFLSPLVGAIVVLLFDRDQERLNQRDLEMGLKKTCLWCYAVVDIRAWACPYCTSEFLDDDDQAGTNPSDTVTEN